MDHALCGGVFGLLGGWLIDRLGRKNGYGGEYLCVLVLTFHGGLQRVLGVVHFLSQHDFHRGVRGVHRGNHLAG